MAEAQTTRPDVDILDDIHDLMTGYPPLMHDRHRVTIDVADGHVTVSGHVKSLTTRRFLMNSVFPQVAGIQQVDDSALYDDEAIRRDVAHLVPYGVYVNTEYGAVILSGTLPANLDEEALVQQIATVDGVHRVLTSLKPAE